MVGNNQIRLDNVQQRIPRGKKRGECAFIIEADIGQNMGEAVRLWKRCRSAARDEGSGDEGDAGVGEDLADMGEITNGGDDFMATAGEFHAQGAEVHEVADAAAEFPG